MIRICFALGTWQIITLAAGLRQADADAPPNPAHEDYLVLYETVEATSALQTAMAEVAGAVWPWKRVIHAFDLMPSVQRRISQHHFDDLIRRVHERLGLDRADELWVCWLTRPPEKLVLEAYAEARIVLYEDGLFSYLPVPLLPPELALEQRPSLFARARARIAHALDARRPVRRFRRHRTWLDPRHAERLRAAYMVLTDVAPLPEAFAPASCHTIEVRHLRETLAACAALPRVADFDAPDADAPRVLVLGQSLSRWGVLSREQEVAVYRQVVDTILAKGYDVLWKEHPRAQEPFFPDLSASAAPGRVRELDLPFALPVELVADRLGLSACVAGISTALFYLPQLYGIPAYTFADALAPFLTKQWALQNDLVREGVPPMGALPATLSSGE